jgi:hypothetical protein
MLSRDWSTKQKVDKVVYKKAEAGQYYDYVDMSR